MSSLDNKYRIHEVAKDFGLPSKTVTEILTDYIAAPKNHMQVLENPELVLLMAQRMLEEQRKNELLQQELRLAKPKADFYDAFIHPECCTNLRATAKELKVPEKMFTAFLIRKRYLYRAPSGTLLPYAKPASDGLFFVKDYIAVNGHQGVYTLVTPKGKSLFLTMLGEIA